MARRKRTPKSLIHQAISPLPSGVDPVQEALDDALPAAQAGHLDEPVDDLHPGSLKSRFSLAGQEIQRWVRNAFVLDNSVGGWSKEGLQNQFPVFF